ncbi:lytic transglycosylase domain-containing protein [Aliarcobacter cibarius]|uniref:lytic transglycosylase domain-containing protein n=1 Tax=Aliarcobacter cibarius TaxID=255507 RepID=UPI001476BB92|nr:lytic transglycosylase domain-containing protein [Aliarcobacter cibarius]
MIDQLFIENCKNINVSTTIVQAIIKNESAKKAFAINVNKDGKSYISFNPKTKDEAKKIAVNYINQGFSIDVGYMQLNSDNFKRLNTNLDEALDPCKNIYFASTVFYNFYLKTDVSKSKIERVKEALSAYNTGSFVNGFKNGYIDKYEKYLQTKYYQAKLIKNI